jgi:hypothetical protein
VKRIKIYLRLNHYLALLLREIITVGRGEEDLRVPTGDGVREPQNRRVEIEIPTAAAPAVAEPAPEPEPEAGPEPLRRFTFALGPLYGHNFGETDGDDGDKTENDLLGAELTFNVLPTAFGGVSLKQAVLWSFNGIDDGLNGRSVVSLDLAPLNLLGFRPFLSANFGGVYGEGVQNGLVAGPELGFDIGLTDSVALRAKVAYDYQFAMRAGTRASFGLAWFSVIAFELECPPSAETGADGGSRRARMSSIAASLGHLGAARRGQDQTAGARAGASRRSTCA